jgi:hypothetical protein
LILEGKVCTRITTLAVVHDNAADVRELPRHPYAMQ